MRAALSIRSGTKSLESNLSICPEVPGASRDAPAPCIALGTRDFSIKTQLIPNDVISLGESCDQDLTEVDRPDAVFDLVKSHIVAFEWRGQEEQSTPEAEGATAGDPLHEIVPGVVDRWQASGVLSW